MEWNDSSPDLTSQYSVDEIERQREAEDVKVERQVSKAETGKKYLGRTVALMAGWLPGISVLVAR